MKSPPAGRFVHDMPLNASQAHVRVNFIEYWKIGEAKVQHFSWVTDIRVSKRKVAYLDLADNPSGVQTRYNAPIHTDVRGALPWCHIFFSTSSH